MNKALKKINIICNFAQVNLLSAKYTFIAYKYNKLSTSVMKN